ncbi:hypothetical protein V8J82_18760 [Gymnodinialimonas sp. 2305UL16-5]|uniref:hypothetical protein n=1 Tax=Gymnodinialimonas mytili TaxID=3126503 RepID=UPI0030ADE851
MLRQILKLALTLSFLAGGAHAQGAAGLIERVLSGVPIAALEGGEGSIIAGYGNGDAVRWIAVRGAQAGRNPNTPNRFAALRSAPPLQQAVIAELGDDGVRRAVGLTARDWIETWEVAQGPVRMGAMDVIPDSEMRLRGALFVAGFDEEPRGQGTVMWRGTTDYAADPQAVQPANPFGGDQGLSLRMAFPQDGRAVWATGWQALDLIQAPSGPNLMTRPDAAALVGGLRRATNLGGVVSVRMWLRNGGALPVTGAEAGPLDGLALVDFANRETEAAAMVLLLRAGLDAEAIAARLRDAWPILGDVAAPAAPEVTADINTITITIRSDWGEDGAATNAAYQNFTSVLDGGRLGVLLSR